jgi:hypothetical protein
MDVR